MKRVAANSVASIALRVFLASAFAQLVATPIAAAQSAKGADQGDKAEAKQHYRTGVKEYNLGHFEDAIKAFERAYGLDPSPILLFNIGQAHRRLGKDALAAFFFRRYLAQNPNAKDRATVEQWIREIEEAAKQTAPTDSPAPRPGAESPPPSAPATSLSPPPVAASPAPAVPPPVPPETPAPKDLEPRAERPSATSWRRPAAWITAALAVGGLAVGIQQTGTYAARVKDFDGPPCNADRDDRGSPECKETYDKGARAKTFAIIGYVSAGVLAAASTALFVMSGDEEPPAHTAFSPRCTLLGLAASCRVSF